MSEGEDRNAAAILHSMSLLKVSVVGLAVVAVFGLV
jgi:hypothetical protein